jgi:hypothetical protein
LYQREEQARAILLSLDLSNSVAFLDEKVDHIISQKMDKE